MRVYGRGVSARGSVVVRAPRSPVGSSWEAAMSGPGGLVRRSQRRRSLRLLIRNLRWVTEVQDTPTLWTRLTVELLEEYPGTAGTAVGAGHRLTRTDPEQG